jgi:hypothetical protein
MWGADGGGMSGSLEVTRSAAEPGLACSAMILAIRVEIS